MSVPYEDPEPLFDWEGGDEPPSADELLGRIRELVHAHIEQGAGLTAEQAAELVNVVDLLDDHLAGGYALPQAWRLAGTGAVGPLPPLRGTETVKTDLL